MLGTNEIFIFASADFTDVKTGSEFNVIFPWKNLHEYEKCSCVLNYVSVNPNYETDYLPKGYSALCILEFINGTPEMLRLLAIYGEKKDYTKHDTLILTQKEALNRLLKEIETIV